MKIGRIEREASPANSGENMNGWLLVLDLRNRFRLTVSNRLSAHRTKECGK